MTRHWILGAALICAAGPASALTVTTKGGHLGCDSEDAVKHLVRAIEADDRANFQAVANRHCRVLPDGRRVTLVSGPGLFRARVSYLLDGREYWSIREALNYDTGN